MKSFDISDIVISDPDIDIDNHYQHQNNSHTFDLARNALISSEVECMTVWDYINMWYIYDF